MTACVAVVWRPLVEIPPVPRGRTVTVAEADFVESALLVAVTVTVEEEGTAEGAVYCPLEIVPTVVFPLATLFTVQETAELVVPVTEAKNSMIVDT